MSFCVMKIRYVKLLISYLCMTNFTYLKFIMTLLVVPKIDKNELHRIVKKLKSHHYLRPQRDHLLHENYI